MTKLSMPLPWLTAPVTCPALIVKLSAPSPWFTVPATVPDAMFTVSAPAPKVTLPLILPVPLAGKVRVLLPDKSVNGPLVALSQTKLSLPAVGVSVQAA
ncbi:hypothetical protein D3C87_1219210 [compost metagenome]